MEKIRLTIVSEKLKKGSVLKFILYRVSMLCEFITDNIFEKHGIGTVNFKGSCLKHMHAYILRIVRSILLKNVDPGSGFCFKDFRKSNLERNR